ncbi:hypothetical protein ACFQX6_23440 [Streptosporangium lutulentum]
MVRGEPEREAGAVPRAERLGELHDDRVRRQGGADPKKDWEKQEPYSRGNFPGYKRIRIEKVDYMVKAADWEFTWNISAGKARVINRGFIANKGGRGYAIYWHTLASDWKKNLPLFEGFAKTFSSKK